MRKVLSGLLLILFYLIFSALIGEIGVRVARAAPPDAPSGWFWAAPDPVTGWSHLPSVSARSFNPFYEFDAQVSFNSRGIRGPESLDYAKADGVYRVLVLGDSFMEAVQVSDGETFADRLRALLESQLDRPVEVVNAGVSGFGTDQQLLWLREEGVKYAPDLVLLAVYPHNDFMNNAEVLESANQGSISKPFFTLDGDRLQLRYFPFDPAAVPAVSSPFAEVAAARVEPGPLAPLGEWLRRNSALYRYADPRIRIAAPRFAAWLVGTGLISQGQESQLVAQGAGYVPLTYGIYRSPPGPEWQQSVRLTEALFAEIRATAEGIGAASAALVIPSPETVYPERWERILTTFPTMNGESWDLQQPEELADTGLAEAGIPAHSLAQDFIRSASDAPLLYFAEEGHWTPQGHELAARSTLNFLAGSGLVPGLAGKAVPVELAPPARSWWEWFVLAILAVLVISLVWSLWKTGPLRWLRQMGSGLGTTGELLGYMIRRRQFALLPLLIVLLAFAGLLVLAQASVVGPFIYTLI